MGLCGAIKCGCAVISSDGSLDVTGSGEPGDAWDITVTSRLSMITVQQLIDAAFPPGSMILWPGATAPAGFALCRGGLLSKSANPKVAALIGTNYGPGDASNVTLPNYVGRVPVGLYVGGPWAATFNDYGGNANAALVAHGHTVSGQSGNDTDQHGHSWSGSVGGDASHSHTSNGGHTEFVFRDSGYYTGYGVTTNGGLALTWGPTAGGNHGHTVSGSAGNITVNHKHFAGTLVADTVAGGVSATNANLPPYTPCNVIIRLG